MKVLRNIKSIGLMLLAFVMALILLPIGWAIGIIQSVIKLNFDYARSCAFTIDQTGNVVCQYLFNTILITNNGYRFGDPDKTISYVLGRNYLTNTTTDLGKFIIFILTKEHILKAIDHE